MTETASLLTHFDVQGQAHMVDVAAKATTRRSATAAAFVELSQAVLAALPQNPKGNPLEVARFAGIQAAKQTSSLIPMCHLAAECPCDLVDARLPKRSHRVVAPSIEDDDRKPGIALFVQARPRDFAQVMCDSRAEQGALSDSQQR